MPKLLAFALMISFTSAVSADTSLEKAKSLRSNGLLQDAKTQLVEVLFSPSSSDATKAESLLILGEIAILENNQQGARDNWNRLLSDYPNSAFAEVARGKLASPTQAVTPPTTALSSPQYALGTALVVGPEEYPWAAPEIAMVVRSPATVLPGDLSAAIKEASRNSAVAALVEVRLGVDVPFEWGRVTCYRPTGVPVWDKTVRVTYPGSEEAIARRFVKKLAAKISGLPCP